MGNPKKALTFYFKGVWRGEEGVWFLLTAPENAQFFLPVGKRAARLLRVQDFIWFVFFEKRLNPNTPICVGFLEEVVFGGGCRCESRSQLPKHDTQKTQTPPSFFGRTNDLNHLFF